MPKKRRAASRETIKIPVLEASIIGISEEQLVGDGILELQEVHFDTQSLKTPVNLPVESEEEYHSRDRIGIHESLVSPRTSFWLGVGFGIFVVGTLGIIALRLFHVAMVEAVVLNMK